MTDRGLPIVDGAPACPFVAFEDDRDERASSPDHRHRCYAELSPAPRALAHQEAYCLASAFPVCPTFQDWARREAARARATSGGTRPPPSDDAAQRNPPRDWSAPPRWADEPDGDGGIGPVAAGGASVGAPDFLNNRSRPERGLAGSAADRLAGTGDEPAGATTRPAEPDEADEGDDVPLVAARPASRPVEPVSAPRPVASPTPASPPSRPGAAAPEPAAAVASDDEDWDGDDDWDDEPGPKRPASERGRGALGIPLGDRRPKVGDTRRRRPEDEAPSWERPRRYEAYPTIKQRVGLSMPSMPSFSRLGVMVIAIVVAAIALFFLPALLGMGGPDEPAASPSPSAGGAAPSASVAPTPTPEPTPFIYAVEPGDTLSSIANKFGVSLAELIEANRETLPDPDVLAIGDQLIIPVPPPDELPAASTAPSAAAP
jgi:hypothetical protein